MATPVASSTGGFLYYSFERRIEDVIISLQIVSRLGIERFHYLYLSTMIRV